MSKHFKAALFDLDGVVLDTESQYTVFWGGQFKKHYPHEEGLEQKIKGQTLVQILDGYFKDKALQESIIEELNLFEEHMQYPFIDGFEAYVADLRSHGVRTAVVTSSNIAKMEKVYARCSRLKPMFDEILTSEDFAASKPSPDCYERAASRFGAAASECIVYEDSINGLKSGRAAQMYVVALATTNPRDVVEPLADVVIDHYLAFDYDKTYRLFNQ